MSTAEVPLDDAGRATLDQVLIGLLPKTALPPGEVYLDAEGTPIARLRRGRVVAVGKPRWPAPKDVRSEKPVVVAVGGEIPIGALPHKDAVLLLPAGGVRPDDARFSAWARAWSATTATVVPVPVPPGEAGQRAEELAAAYSSGPLLTVMTVPQPTGPGRTLFFTGLSGSGKSTLARAVVDRVASRRTVTLLDGDVVRTHLSRGLGFSQEDRDTNIRRIGWVAAQVTKHGGLAVCAPIAPYDETRRWVRHEVEAAGGPGSFLLVWVSTPIEACEARDVKGLYAKARAGQITNFTGVNDPYEEPADADLVLDTSVLALEDAVTAVLDLLDRDPSSTSG